MAARENQGLHIALIIFVILTIMLIVSTYYFFSNYTQERDKGKALAADNQKLTTEAAAAKDESATYKGFIGGDAKDKEGILALKNKDIEVYGKGVPEANQNYHFLVEHMAGELAKANAEIVEAKNHEKELDAKIKADQADKEKEIAKYTQGVSETSADLEKVRKEFTASREELNKSKNSLSAKFGTKAKEFDELTKKSGEQVATLTADNGKLSKRIQDMNDEKLRGVKANEVPDGKIVRVDQRARTVWINRGSADGLRRQTSFSVFDADDANPLEGTLKGKIEVVRLIRDHLAEARIVEDNLGHPMMFGDPIFSVAWEPGRAEHFALAGFMDFDNDGRSDRQRVRDLIALNGGVIDAEIDDHGKRSGEMSINTKYLVLGKEPTTEGKINSYSEIRGEAQTLGVKTISLNEFLDYMGFKSEDRTVRLDKDAVSSDFKARLPEGVQRVRPVDRKQERRNAVPTTQKITY